MDSVSVIPLDAEDLREVSETLQARGVSAQVYGDFDSWASHQPPAGGRNGSHSAANGVNGTNGANGAGHSNAAARFHERCLLLVGPIRTLAENRLAQRIAEKHPGLPIVAIGRAPNLDDVVSVVRQGATDLVALPSPPDDVWRSVEAALDAGRQSEAERQRVLELRRRLATLTDAECEVLDAIMRGLANKQTAHALSIGLRTVELRRARIMKKMGARSVAELVKLVCDATCPDIRTVPSDDAGETDAACCATRMAQPAMQA